MSSAKRLNQSKCRLGYGLTPKEACVRWDAHWRNLANMTEPCMCGGDAAFLSNYSDRMFNLASSIKLIARQAYCVIPM